MGQLELWSYRSHDSGCAALKGLQTLRFSISVHASHLLALADVCDATDCDRGTGVEQAQLLRSPVLFHPQQVAARSQPEAMLYQAHTTQRVADVVSSIQVWKDVVCSVVGCSRATLRQAHVTGECLLMQHWLRGVVLV